MNGLCYRFDPDTKEYIRPDQAQESPLEPGVWLWPANTTLVEPPPHVDGKTRHFAGGSWIYQQVPLPIIPAPVDPRTEMIVSRFQGKAALYNANLLTQVEAYFADSNTSMLDKLAWQDTLTWYRLSPLVLSLGAKLNLTDAQLDQLFTDAAKIQI